MPPTASATHAQIEALLEFMSENEELARGLLRGADGRVRAKRLWESLCDSLNSMGTCTKSVEQWQRVWADKKHLAKKAAAAARRSALATGGGPSTAPSLSEVDFKILTIMGEGFGEPQTDARVPAFELILQGAVSPTHLSAASTVQVRAINNMPSQEPPLVHPNEALETPQLNQQTLNHRRAPRVRRQLRADVARNRIIEVEEQRLQVEIRRNEVLDEIKTAIVDLCMLLREHISRST